MNKFTQKAREIVRSGAFPSKVLTVVLIAVLIVVNVTVYALDAAYGLYLYRPEKDRLVLSGATDALFADAIAEGREVTVMFCMPEDEVRTHETGYVVYETARRMAERYPGFLSLEFLNIITKRDSKGNRVDVSRFTKDQNGNDIPLYKTSVIFLSGENYRVITDTATTAGFAGFYTLDSNKSATAYNGEEVISAMVSWVLQDTHPTAYFTVYHGESAEVSFSNLLSCAGFYVESLDLRTQDVPENAALVLISHPTADLERAAEGSGIKTEAERLRAYADRGGTVYVSLDPYAQRLPVLESFLAEYGIAIDRTETATGTVVPNIVRDMNYAITADGLTLITKYANNAVASSIGSRVTGSGSGNVLVRECAALKLSDGAQPLLQSSSSSTAMAGAETVSAAGNFCIAALSSREGTGGTSRVFAVSSVYLTAADALVAENYTNKDFLYSLFEECCGVSQLPYGVRPVVYDTTERLENLTMGMARRYAVLIMAVPLAVAAVGTVVLIRRKNR